MCLVNWFDLTLVTSLTTLLVSTPAHILLWEMFAEKVFLRSDFEIKFRIFGSIISISLSLASQLFNAAATLPVMAEFHQSSKIHICFTQLKCNIFFPLVITNWSENAAAQVQSTHYTVCTIPHPQHFNCYRMSKNCPALISWFQGQHEPLQPHVQKTQEPHMLAS